MSRTLVVVDRLLILLFALAALIGGLAILNWQFSVLFDWPKRLSVEPVTNTVNAGWFVWAFAAVTLLLGLLGLWWLLAHVPRPTGSQVRVESQDASGTVRVDLSSVADAAAERFGQLAPVLDASGSASKLRGSDVIEIRVRVDIRANADRINEVAQQTQTEIQAATSTTRPVVRFLLDPPSRVPLKSKSATAPRVH